MALFAGLSWPAQAAEVGLRMGAHGTFGRVVFVVPPLVRAQMSLRNGGVAVLSLPGAGTVPSAARGTLNILSISGGNDTASLALVAGSRPVLWQGAGKVVVDVFSAGTASAAPAGSPPAAASAATPVARGERAAVPAVRRPTPSAHAAAPVRTIAPESAVVPGNAMAPGSAPGQAPEILPVRVHETGRQADSAPPAADNTPAKPSTAENVPVAAAPLAVPDVAPSDATNAVPTDGLVAERLAPETVGGRDAILVPFDRGVGAAAFALGGLAHVVFDDSKPVDLAQLKDDPVFASARIRLLPAATHLTLRLAADRRLSLKRRPDGWVVAVLPRAGNVEAASVQMQAGVLRVGTHKAADTVVIDDPVTGGRLLVGTVADQGEAVVAPHVSSEFSLLPSWAGVLVAAVSDRLALHASKEGFALSVGPGPHLAAVIVRPIEQAMADAGPLTRHYDFLPLPLAVQRARLTGDMQGVAMAPKLGRFAPRLRAAQDMLALGLDREAASMLRLALREEPGQANNVDARGLLAMADWLARHGDGAGLAAPDLGGSDEITLWRALLQPAADGKSAASVAQTWRLLLAYPAPLRRALLPLAAETMLQGGEREAAAALLARVPDSSLDPQRAEALQMDHKTDAALALLDKIGQGRDRKRAASAIHDAVELRLASGKIKPAEAAAALDKSLYAWRDDARETEDRLRIAALRSQAGAWRPALAMLRETEAIYPATHDRVHAQEHQVIADLLASGAAERLAPLDLVSLVEENADLLAEKGASETLAPVLVDKLLALDLPERADPILGKLMAATESPEAKAGLGARLAALRLDQRDEAGAKAALSDSQADGLPAALATHRAVLQAGALALEGADDAALALLASFDTPEALEMRARLMEKRRDWHGVETALQQLAAASLPAGGSLTDSQQDLVLRLAGAASEAGDTAYLQRMRTADAARLTAGPRTELFQALATRPVQGLSDLPRSARETAAARAVPAALASYEGH